MAKELRLRISKVKNYEIKTDSQNSFFKLKGTIAVAKKNSRKQKGFTLIELMIVIAIVGILASIAVPLYSFYRAKGYMAATRSDVKNAHTAVLAWVTENSNTPPPDEVFDGPGTMVHYPIATVTRGVRISIDNGGDVTATHENLPGMYKIIFNGAIEVDTLAP